MNDLQRIEAKLDLLLVLLVILVFAVCARLVLP